MKVRYIIALLVLVLLFTGFEISVIATNMIVRPWITQAISGAGVFVALMAAVIALHASDRKLRKISAAVEVSIDRSKPGKHVWEQIPKTVRHELLHDQEVFHSEKVNFAIINTSGFTWHKPTLSFHLPLLKQHPHRLEGGQWVVGFNSNLFNFPDEIRTLRFGDTAVLSNSNLPFWNHGDQFVFWVRMSIDAGGQDPFAVRVSLNAHNAEGITIEALVDPSA